MMIHSEELDKLFIALADFNKECPALKKDKKVVVKTRTGGNYSFEYATFGQLLTVTKPVLSKHGLAIIQHVSDKGIQTMLTHKSGQYLITDPLSIVVDDENKNDPQKHGSAISYFKRYQYSALLTQDADYDDDGNLAAGNEAIPETKITTLSNTNKGDKKEKEETKKIKTTTTEKVEENDSSKPNDSSFDIEEAKEYITSLDNIISITKYYNDLRVKFKGDKEAIDKLNIFFADIQKRAKELKG